MFFLKSSIKTWPDLHHGAKSCVNIAGVALVQNTTDFYRFLYCLTVQVIFDVFEAEHDKGATLETAFMGDIVTFSSSHLLTSVDNQIWKDAFKEDNLSFLIIDFRSLPEKPRRDKQDFCVFGKIHISGLSWDITIQDGITNLLLKSDITLQSGAQCRRPVCGFFMEFLILVPGLTKFIWCCRLSLTEERKVCKAVRTESWW